MAQGNEEDVAVENLHIGVGLARMIYVVCTVSPTAAVQAPAIIDRTDAQLAPAGPAIGLRVCNLLARVFRYFPPNPKMSN